MAQGERTDPGRIGALTSWHADWVGLRVGVLGLGVTGFAAADVLVELGADVLVVCSDADEKRANILAVLGVPLVVDSELVAPPGELVHFEPEILVVSPGFRPNHPILEWARARGIVIWGDIELAWRLRDKGGTPAEWITVTGTNGKTTTVQMAALMLHTAGVKVAACGNIGTPVLDAIRNPDGFDVLVVELSSYQLNYMRKISPYASVCLNVATDHIDWHGSAAAYRDAKARVYANTRVACIYNRADTVTERMVRDADVVEGARAISFGLSVPGPGELGIVDGILCDRAFVENRSVAIELATVDELAPLGLATPHVLANILAASALARSYGASPENIRAGLAMFQLDEHRMQEITRAGEVLWIDDSKATNPHAADASLSAFSSVVWVVGGLLKGVDIDDLVRVHAPRLRAAIIIGADRGLLRGAFARHAPGVTVLEVNAPETEQIMPRVVELAVSVAEAGDVVLLAPAAASMDQFSDYADRGRQFALAVYDQVGDEADGGFASRTLQH